MLTLPASRYAWPRQRARVARVGARPCTFKPVDELADVRRKRPAITSTQPDVEVLTLSHAPAVAFEIGTEVQLWKRSGDRACHRIRKPELCFLRDDEACAQVGAADHSGDRTEVTACTNHDASFDAVVGHPGIAVPATSVRSGVSVSSRAPERWSR